MQETCDSFDLVITTASVHGKKQALFEICFGLEFEVRV